MQASTSLLRGRRGRSRAVHIVTALLSTEVKPAGAGCPHPSRCSAKAQHRATFPQGEGFAPVTSVPKPYKNVPRPAAHLNISPFWGEIFHTRKARISPCRRHDFTRGFAADFTAALRPAFPKGKAMRLRRPSAALPRNRKIYFSFLWLFAPRIFSGRRGKISPKGSFEKVVIK